MAKSAALLGLLLLLGAGAAPAQDALGACQAETARLAARVEELEARFLSLSAGDVDSDVDDEVADKPPVPFGTPAFYKNCAASLFCVVLAAMAAGLTMGLVSIEPMEMEIIVKTEEKDMREEKERLKLKDDQQAAYSVLPLIKDHHRLLVTLLLLNSIANEALPLFLDQIVPSWMAVAMSVSLVLLFGEIIPSAIFTGSGQLRIAARFAPLVTAVLFFLAPIAWPIAKVLDKLLGEDHKGRYNFAELRAIVGIHARLNTDEGPQHVVFKSHDDQGEGIITTEAPHGFGHDSIVVFSSAPSIPAKSTKLKADGTGYYVKPCMPLTGRDTGCCFQLYSVEGEGADQHLVPVAFKQGELTSGIFKLQERDELKIMHGVMNLTHMTAGEAMQPLSEVWMLEMKQRLTLDVMKDILKCGYSRLPVYDGNKHNLRGFILAKKLIVVSPEAEGGKGRTVDSIDLEQLVVVPPCIPMLDLLNKFQEDRKHMALVTNSPNAVVNAWAQNKEIPPDVHMAGIITLEDVIEKLLQEDIDDEHDALKQQQQTLTTPTSGPLHPGNGGSGVGFGGSVVGRRRIPMPDASPGSRRGSDTQNSPRWHQADVQMRQVSAPLPVSKSGGSLAEPLLPLQP